jgi:hypothetical protein
LSALPFSLLFVLFFAAVALSHWTLLRLPYYWDEGGYYIPAAFDFYNTGTLIPHFTNAHPPLPNVLIGSLWHIVGMHILATRLLVSAFAAAALLAVYRLALVFLRPAAAFTVTFLTAVYPIWFAQSTLAHADIFAATFTLWAFATYFASTFGVAAGFSPRDRATAAQAGAPSSPTVSSSAKVGSTVPQAKLPFLAPATKLSSRPELQNLSSQPESAAPTNLSSRPEHRSLIAMRSGETCSSTLRHPRLWVAILFTLAALSKETAILQPVALATWQAFELLRNRNDPEARRTHLSWIAALLFPILPLAAWYAYHHARTGFTFGNPEYLRYNATANLSVEHIFTAIRYRFLHLFWQRNIWLPIVLAIACLFLKPRPTEDSNVLSDELSSRPEQRSLIAMRSGETRSFSPCLGHLPAAATIAFLILANWLAFSILGGALLTRYLLPVYPLILLVCVAIWQAHTRSWPTLAAFTAAAFIAGLWINPPTSFAPEDTLVYRDMIVVHQQAINYVVDHYPDAHILTAWPVAADLFRPELGYVQRRMQVVSVEDFSLPQIAKAATEPERFDTAIVFTTHYLAPEYRHYLLSHPNSKTGREFAADRDLTPTEIATLLHGQVVWQKNLDGEWAAVLRFNRSYEARLAPPRLRP